MVLHVGHCSCRCLQEIQRLECEPSATGGGTLTHRHWRQVCDQFDHRAGSAAADPFRVPPSAAAASTELCGMDMSAARAHAQLWHKRCTVEMLVKSKLLSEATKAFSQPHHFERFNYTTAAYCDYCTHVLWGLLKTGWLSHYLVDMHISLNDIGTLSVDREFIQHGITKYFYYA